MNMHVCVVPSSMFHSIPFSPSVEGGKVKFGSTQFNIGADPSYLGKIVLFYVF